MAEMRNVRSGQGKRAANTKPLAAVAVSAEPVSAAAAEKQPRATRRRSTTAAAESGTASAAAVAPPSSSANVTDAVETIPVATSVVTLEAGLHAIQIVTESSDESGTRPVWVAQVPGTGNDPLEVFSASGSGDQWVDGAKKIVAVRVPSGGALLTATVFGSPDRPPASPEIIVRSLDKAPTVVGVASSPPTGPSGTSEAVANAPPSAPAPNPTLPDPAAVVAAPATMSRVGREIRLEVTVHLERLGDRTFPGSTWAGKPGEQKRVEGFSVRPLQELQPNEIEYKALHPGGVETQWIPGPQFCGTRGQSTPITGLAIRIAPHVQDQFSVVYQAAFFRSGITEPRGNGAPCLPRIAGDALEGINVRIVQGRA
jgi:hypothetical protein